MANNPLNEVPYTPKFILNALANRKQLEQNLTGSLHNIDLLIDLDLAVKQAKLTDKQLQALKLYYYEGYSQEQVAKKMNISQQFVGYHLSRVRVKITKVVKKWGEQSFELFG